MTRDDAMRAVALVVLSSQRNWGEEEVEVWAGLLERSGVPGPVCIATVETLLMEIAPRDLSPGAIIQRCRRSPTLPPGYVAPRALASPQPEVSFAEARRVLRDHPLLREAFVSLFAKVERRSEVIRRGASRLLTLPSPQSVKGVDEE